MSPLFLGGGGGKGGGTLTNNHINPILFSSINIFFLKKTPFCEKSEIHPV